MSIIALEQFNNMPFARQVGFAFVSAVDGSSVVELKLGDEHANAQGIGHGGIVPVLVDAAGALAILSTFERPDAVRVLTADLRVNLIGAARLGSVVTARGSVAHAGRSASYARVEVTDDAGDMIGLGQLTCIARPAPAT